MWLEYENIYKVLYSFCKNIQVYLVKQKTHTYMKTLSIIIIDGDMSSRENLVHLFSSLHHHISTGISLLEVKAFFESSPRIDIIFIGDIQYIKEIDSISKYINTEFPSVVVVAHRTLNTFAPDAYFSSPFSFFDLRQLLDEIQEKRLSV